MEERPGKGKHLALDSPHRRKEAALHQLPAKWKKGQVKENWSL
jgi:hypothetical protein